MHKTALHAFVLLACLLAGCSLPGSAPTIVPVPGEARYCGDGRCSGPENAASCPQDCTAGPGPAAEASATPEMASGSGLLPAGAEDTYWVTNPASGARLFVQVFHPEDWNASASLPALVLMPGGIAESDPQRAARLAGQGFIVIIFDADGRGQSQGAEDYNGFITQDGLAEVIRAAASLPGLDADRYGLVSYSYGVTAATGALARHPGLPVDFYIDWEGPVDRNYTTVGCPADPHGDIPWQPCSDDAWWAEREALGFIGDVQVPYQRIQSQEDHVQPSNDHAIDIINAALAGGVPWVRLNDYPPNQNYDADNPPAMIPEAQDRQLEQLVALYARHLIEEVLPSLP